ncbi:hypothetical protein GQR60_03040 [Labilibaculum sp. A4]|uniref:hypothetical protein n=1 Tax=Labilibaculum euxinus TaxID=2686357 RepID=UPI000F618C5E|nr:hypothetical protein [Labilibaculum euxinus]MDQ1770474.1 hypothetical protein [Labilibaculum euxinus]MWN75307.1 hypothetical protein [Labilibaculum euxinus]
MHRKIENVRARIEFVNKLTSVKEAFRGTELVKKSENGDFNHPYIHFDGLRFYLILTCFDILGSNKEYLPFSNWLTSSNTKNERAEIFAQMNKNEITSESVNDIYLGYNKIYGVTKGFKRFIAEILSDENRKLLLDNIMIRKFDNVSGIQLKYTPPDSKKIDFLYQVRNSFTHTGEPYATPAGGIFDIIEDGRIIDGGRKWGYYCIHIEKNNKFYYEYYVRKWPKILIEILNNTIETL